MPRRIAKRPDAKRPETPDTTGIAELGPTPERLQHGPIEVLPRAIADSIGRLSRPYRAVDTLRGGAARPSARPRYRASAHRRTRPPSGPDGAGSAHRGGARNGVARDPGGRRHRLAGGLVSLACARLAAIVEGMGHRARLERPPGQPGGRFRHPHRGVGRARIAPHAMRKIVDHAFFT